MTLEPSIRRVGVATAIAALGLVLVYFVPYPHPGSDAIVTSLPIGFISGYLLWPWFEHIRYPVGYFRPSPTRVLIALGFACLLTINHAYLQIVIMNDGVNVEGMIVVFLVSAFFLYVKLGDHTQSQS